MADSKARILVIDDEQQIRNIICYVLNEKGYECVEASTATQAWELFKKQHFDLIMLDVMLPDLSGVELCRRIRTDSQTPVLLVSALADEDNRIKGLEAGVDDYVTKPFSPREVGLRVEAILRRCVCFDQSLEYGGVRVDPDTCELSFQGRKLCLPMMELQVLVELIRHAPNPVSFVELLSTVWNTQESIGGREMVRITVHRLRTHLRSLGIDEAFIESVRGQGYRIVPLSRL